MSSASKLRRGDCPGDSDCTQAVSCRDFMPSAGAQPDARLCRSPPNCRRPRPQCPAGSKSVGPGPRKRAARSSVAAAGGCTADRAALGRACAPGDAVPGETVPGRNRVRGNRASRQLPLRLRAGRRRP